MDIGDILVAKMVGYSMPGTEYGVRIGSMEGYYC